MMMPGLYLPGTEGQPFMPGSIVYTSSEGQPAADLHFEGAAPLNRGRVPVILPVDESRLQQFIETQVCE